MHWVIDTSLGFDLISDRHNQEFLFDALEVVTDFSQASSQNVVHQAAILTLYRYTCIQIKDLFFV